ncbi:hypothetical protein ZEAMMB73_Zm00001d009490 [Zea mays]|uniref:Uncharacterized protein n=1 Tax=Zea mays TaxID=4577 RepID=A0A1D6FJQ2_MAIZE|nr:hypothetical protein ZEAMMB73_Zm00001d009490 [Zea mays]
MAAATGSSSGAAFAAPSAPGLSSPASSSVTSSNGDAHFGAAYTKPRHPGELIRFDAPWTQLAPLPIAAARVDGAWTPAAATMDGDQGLFGGGGGEQPLPYDGDFFGGLQERSLEHLSACYFPNIQRK